MPYRKQFGKRGGAVRRKADGILPVSRKYIARLIEKAERVRDKALIALLYLTGRRISEVVGRVYKNKKGEVIDVWEGICTEDFKVGLLEETKVLRVRIRILKRGRVKKKGLRQVYGFFDMYMNDPFTPFILEWLSEVKTGKVFQICRQRAWQIMHEVDPEIWNHWFRHQRLTHLSDTMDPFELQDFAKFARLETALNYVHKSPTKILAKVKEADDLWK